MCRNTLASSTLCTRYTDLLPENVRTRPCEFHCRLVSFIPLLMLQLSTLLPFFHAHFHKCLSNESESFWVSHRQRSDPLDPLHSSYLCRLIKKLQLVKYRYGTYSK